MLDLLWDMILHILKGIVRYIGKYNRLRQRQQHRRANDKQLQKMAITNSNRNYDKKLQ